MMMLDRVITGLHAELDLNADQIADLLWLMTIVHPSQNESSNLDLATSLPFQSLPSVPLRPFGVRSPLDTASSDSEETARRVPEEGAPLRPRRSGATGQTDKSLADRATQPIKVPDTASLRSPLALSRALRPLIRQVPTGAMQALDEAATVKRIAEEQIWIPVTQPKLEPWLDVVIVVDENPSMQVWRKTVQDFRNLLTGYGAFRDVQLYGLVCQHQHFYLRPNWGSDDVASELLKPECLIDPNQRRLILMVSDAVGPYWWNGDILSILQRWSSRGMVAMIQMLPEWLWERTALREADRVLLGAADAGVVNRQLLSEEESEGRVVMPVLALESDWLLSWSRMVAGVGSEGIYGRLLPNVDDLVRGLAENRVEVDRVQTFSGQQRIDFFQRGASILAKQLMGLLAATPVITLPVIRLIQAAMIPQSKEVLAVAEVLLGGLLRLKLGQTGAIEDRVYEFVDEGEGERSEIRAELLKNVAVSTTVRALSTYIDKQFGLSLRDFLAELSSELDVEGDAEILAPFAIVSATVLRRKGREYAKFIQTVEQYYPEALPQMDLRDRSPWDSQRLNEWAIAQNIQLVPQVVPIATIRFDDRPSMPDPEDPNVLRSFEFQVVTLDDLGNIASQKTETASYFIEPLGAGVKPLELVAIPGGRFLMGSPEEEAERQSREGPQREVTVPPFFMSKYQVTQAQWRYVAETLPEVGRELKVDPVIHKGPDNPVERVSWLDVQEFCARVTVLAGRICRLPSEAEWEYACRAGTTTPFHFGETISPEVANYDGSATPYGKGKKGVDRNETIPVGSLDFANSFGLYDMHGNVWEWCEDDFHDNYQGAPDDGSARKDASNDSGSKILRGGSWIGNPWLCRSAFRNWYPVVSRFNYFGFRVVYSSSRIL